MQHHSPEALKAAIRIRRGLQKLDDVNKKLRPDVERAMRDERACLTFLRTQPSPLTGFVGAQPHVRAV